jgi:hypothetical protein
MEDTMKSLMPHASMVAFAVCTSLTGVAEMPQPEGQELRAAPSSGSTAQAQVGAKKRLTIETPSRHGSKPIPCNFEWPPRACQI